MKNVVNLETNGVIMSIDELNEALAKYESLAGNHVVQLMRYVRNGLSYTHFQKLSGNTPFSMNEWSRILHLSERTLQRYKKDRLSFESLQSERILEIILLQKKGVDVFGSEAKYYSWLNSINVSLGGISPRELLDNSFGISLVRDALLRIEHGVLA
jgi:putative toxin-antitoxin system antitoxin component (TIGR02293 family)